MCVCEAHSAAGACQGLIHRVPVIISLHTCENNRVVHSTRVIKITFSREEKYDGGIIISLCTVLQQRINKTCFSVKSDSCVRARRVKVRDKRANVTRSKDLPH